MPVSVDSPDILSQLRRETRPYHDALEQNAFNETLHNGTVTAGATAWFLGKLYGVLQPYETQLRRHAAEFGPEWALERRFRAHLILEDLRQLNPAAPAPPLCPTLPPLATRPQLLGAMYVLEGSTLGGQVISRQLAKADIPLRTYFSGYGPETGPMWKMFCQQLTDTVSPAEQAAVVQSASQMFQCLSAWMNQP